MSWPAEISSGPVRQAIGVLFVSYAMGCVTLGYYLVLFAIGKDIRQLGSGSVGAKNVGRALGHWGFAATLVGDVGKGALAVWATGRVSASDLLKLLAMLAVVTGHIWPAQLRFHGGKGIATSAGALMVFDPWIMAGLLALFAVAAVALRNTVLAGLAAFSLLPLISGFLGQPALNIIGFALLTALVLFAHRKNIEAELAHRAANRPSHTPSRKSPR